jgi:hypothetical protein
MKKIMMLVLFVLLGMACLASDAKSQYQLATVVSVTATILTCSSIAMSTRFVTSRRLTIYRRYSFPNIR